MLLTGAEPCRRDRPLPGRGARTLLLVAGVAGFALLGLGEAHADSCSAVCAAPEDEPACAGQQPVWGFREPGGVCRGGAFGLLESREIAEDERRRLARSQKRVCEETGDCDRFEALDAASLVCLACAGDNGPAEAPTPEPGGHAPPCAKDEWLQAGASGTPARCFVEFAALPPRLAQKGRCVEGDCRAGNGTLRWPSGESYTGAFRGGRRHGSGAFRWPDGRAYVGEWREGLPTGLGTRVHADGSHQSGYFSRGRYRGASLRDAPPAASPVARRRGPLTSCEEACTEDAELELARIMDEYECCFARNAFCLQKARQQRRACEDDACRDEARGLESECQVRYACDAAQKQKIARFRKEGSACVEGCSAQELDEQGLRLSERGTLVDPDESAAGDDE